MAPINRTPIPARARQWSRSPTPGNARRGSLIASIPLGTKGTFAQVVAPQHLANQFEDATLPPVLATPVMIMAMENAALNALKPYLAPGEQQWDRPQSPIPRPGTGAIASARL